jgi:glycosyltransferase involved in cell wall biosynthesis
MVNTGFLPVPPDKGGSIESHAFYLSNELARLGNEVHFVTSVNPRASFHDKVILHKLPRIPFKFHGTYSQTLVSFGVGGFFASLRAMYAISSNEYDIIHIHGHVPGFFLIPFIKSVRSIFTVHNPNPWMVRSTSMFKQAFREVAFKSVELKIIKNVDYVIAVSEGLRDELVKRFEMPSEKVKVIPNGVDINLFRPKIHGYGHIIEKYELPQEYVLFVGRLVEQKGLHYLLNAIKGTSIHVVIVGDGPLFSYLNTLAQRLGISEQIRFVGAVPLDDLTRIYSAAKLFVIPSVAEGMALVGLEAMASGLPIIASRIPGMEKIVVDGYNGFLFDVGDVEKLRGYMLLLLKEDVDLAKRMGERSRKIVESQYSWEHIAKKTYMVYQEVINS